LVELDLLKEVEADDMLLNRVEDMILLEMKED
jgi:hypothetical protein